MNALEDDDFSILAGLFSEAQSEKARSRYCQALEQAQQSLTAERFKQYCQAVEQAKQLLEAEGFVVFIPHSLIRVLDRSGLKETH